MPTQIEPIIAPRGGLRYDLPADLIALFDMSDCRNVFFEDGLVKKRYGYVQFGDNLPLDGAVRAIAEYVNFSGTRLLMVLTENEIYQWSDSDSDWNSISDAQGLYGLGRYGEGAYGANITETFTMAETEFFSHDHVRKTTEINPWWVVTNGIDPIKKKVDSGVIADLITDFPTGVTSLLARHLIEFKTYLLLLDVTENGNRYPQRVRWSNTALPDDFINGNASYLDLTGPDWIMGGVRFRGDYVAICKERSIWVGYATGDSYIFEFDRKTSGIGCVAGQTIKNVEDTVVYMSHDDVYAFNGIDNEPIAGSVREEMFKTLNTDKIAQCHAKVVEDQKEYWLFVPSATSDYCDIAWVFNYGLGKWTRHAWSDYLTIAGAYRQQSGLTIGELVGTIGEQNWRFGDRLTTAAMPVVLLGDNGGYVYKYDRLANNDDGTIIDSWFSTKDFNPTQMGQRFFVNRIDVYYRGTGLDVSYSTDKGVTWTAIGSLSANSNMDSPQRLFLKLDCLMCRFRFRNNTSGQRFDFNRANIYWEPSGLRLS
jgi:hypothetical protein